VRYLDAPYLEFAEKRISTNKITIDYKLPIFFEKSKLLNTSSLTLPQITLVFLNLTYSKGDLRGRTFGDRIFS
jgi:hypothetical protein